MVALKNLFAGLLVLSSCGLLRNLANAACEFTTEEGVPVPAPFLFLNNEKEDIDHDKVLITIIPSDATVVTDVESSTPDHFNYNVTETGEIKITLKTYLQTFLLDECDQLGDGELCTMEAPMDVLCEGEPAPKSFSVSLIIEDVNNQPPIFNATSYQYDTTIPWPAHVPLNRDRISVTDKDFDPVNAVLNFSINTDKVRFESVMLTTGRPFTYLVDMYLKDEDNQLSAEEQSLTVTATDSVNSAIVSLELNTRQINVLPPKFTSVLYSFHMDEPMNASDVLTPLGQQDEEICAVDPEGSTFEYRIGNLGSDLVNINPSTGEVKLEINADTDYFASKPNQVAVIEIIAKETGGAQLESKAVVIIYFTYIDPTTTTTPEVTTEVTCEPCPTSPTTTEAFPTTACPEPTEVEVTCPEVSTQVYEPCTTPEPADCTCPTPTVEPCLPMTTSDPAECTCPSCAPAFSTPEGFWSSTTTSGPPDGSTDQSCPPCTTSPTEAASFGTTESCPPVTDPSECTCPTCNPVPTTIEPCLSTATMDPPECTCPTCGTDSTTFEPCPSTATMEPPECTCPTCEPAVTTSEGSSATSFWSTTETPEATDSSTDHSCQPCAATPTEATSGGTTESCPPTECTCPTCAPTTTSEGASAGTTPECPIECPTPDPSTACPTPDPTEPCPPCPTTNAPPGPESPQTECPKFDSSTCAPLVGVDPEECKCAGVAGFVAGIVVLSVLFVGSAGAAAFLWLQLRKVPPSPFNYMKPEEVNQSNTRRFSVPPTNSNAGANPTVESTSLNNAGPPGQTPRGSDFGTMDRNDRVRLSQTRNPTMETTSSAPSTSTAAPITKIPPPDYSTVDFSDNVEIINNDELEYNADDNDYERM